MRSPGKVLVAAVLVLALGGSRAAHADAAPTPLARGLAELEASTYDAAEKSLSAIKGADEAMAKAGLAELAFVRGNYPEAERLAGQVGGSAAAKAKATLVRAKVLEATGRRGDGIRLLEAQKGAPGAEGRKIRLLLGELLLAKGKRNDAEPVLMTIIGDYNSGAITNTDAEGLALAGRAAHLLRVPKDANTLFNESERADKKRVDTLLARAELFLEKYDPGHAEEVLREALALSPKRPDLLVAMARVKLDQTDRLRRGREARDRGALREPEATGAFARARGARAARHGHRGGRQGRDKGLARRPRPT
jgi:tetratricopeptide (TPR) repeat protein